MMKKVVSVLLALFLMLGGLCASAETTVSAEKAVTPLFEVSRIDPEGYAPSEVTWLSPSFCVIRMTPAAEGKPYMEIAISYDDSKSEITFNDEMPEAEFLERAKAVMVNEETGEEIPYTVEKTGLGTKILIDTVSDDLGTASEFYSIWHGYEVSVYAYNKQGEAYSAVTEDQQAMVLQFLTDMDFTKIISETASGDENPLTGEWFDETSQRASMVITSPDAKEYSILISWSSSAWEMTEWRMKATLDASGSLVYTGGVKTDIVYNEDDTIKEEKVLWEDASGRLTRNADGKFVWEDSKEPSASGCLFSK